MTPRDPAGDVILAQLERYYDSGANRADLDAHIVSCPDCRLRLEQINVRLRDLACREVVELATDYLESSLEPDFGVRVDDHLQLCEGCRDFLEQMRRCVDLLRQGGAGVGAGERQEAVPGRLLEAFRARYPTA